MMYGKAERYFDAFKKWSGTETVFLYIELKTGDDKIIYKLSEMMKKNQNKKVIYLIGGKAGTKREKVANEIFERTKRSCHVLKAVDYFKMHRLSIEKIKLYKSKSWWRRLNHF
jgi:hypothetical protein